MNRRSFIQQLVKAGALTAAAAPFAAAAKAQEFQFKYMVGSSLYGKLPLSEILPDIHKTGASYIDIWPLGHADQREQMEAMGHDAFEQMLKQHQLQLGCLTHYNLGPFGLAKEMPVAKRFGCKTMVCGARGPNGLSGKPLKQAVKVFVEQMKPHVAVAEEHDVTIAVENHGHSVIDTVDSLKWLCEYAPSKNLGVALAPYHLESAEVDAKGLGKLIEDLGNCIAIFYAWQYGRGCMKKLPKEQELLQMPGRGDMDFRPAVKALKKVNYQGFTEIFMHPVPRGIPILPTASQTTAEINRSRAYLEEVRKNI